MTENNQRQDDAWSLLLIVLFAVTMIVVGTIGVLIGPYYEWRTDGNWFVQILKLLPEKGLAFLIALELQGPIRRRIRRNSN